MIQPRKRHARRVLMQGARNIRYCQYPGCGMIIPGKNKQYCDRECQNAHSALLKLDRRPKNIICENCGKDLDVMKRGPSDWKIHKHHFCDGICVDAYRRKNNAYIEMSEKGGAAIKEFKKETGKRHFHNRRSLQTSENNKKAPPKAKYFFRSGKIWGYEVHFIPNENNNGYIASIPDLPEIGRISVKSKKEGILELRKIIVESREKGDA